MYPLTLITNLGPSAFIMSILPSSLLYMEFVLCLDSFLWLYHLLVASVILALIMHYILYVTMVKILLDQVYSQAEVQSVFSDGALSLHTRSLKYGKVAKMNYQCVINNFDVLWFLK